MPRGAAPGERRGGRAKGTRNKTTVERLERERVAERIAVAAGHPGVGKAIAKAMDQNRKLAKEELEEAILSLKEAVAKFQEVADRAPPGSKNFRASDWSALKTWLELLIDTCVKLAEFQSPKFRIAVAAAPPSSPGPAIEDGTVIDLNDPIAASNVYRRRIRRVVG
jgi:hypothetical protein